MKDEDLLHDASPLKVALDDSAAALSALLPIALMLWRTPARRPASRRPDSCAGLRDRSVHRGSG